MGADWYCRIADREVGPFSGKQLKKMAATGDVRPDDPIRQGSTGPWIPAYRVKGLFAAPPPAPDETPPMPRKAGGKSPSPTRVVPVATPVEPSGRDGGAQNDVLAAIADDVYSARPSSTRGATKRTERLSQAPAPAADSARKVNKDKRLLVWILVGVGVFSVVGISLALWTRLGSSSKPDSAAASQSTAAKDAVAQALEEENRAAEGKLSTKPPEKADDKTAAAKPADTATTKPTAPDASTKSKPTESAASKPNEKPLKNEAEVIFGVCGGVHVLLNSIKSTRLILEAGPPEGIVTPRCLLVQIAMDNKSGTERTYKPWSSREGEKAGVRLMDDTGKAYPMKHFNEGEVRGQAAEGPIKSQAKQFDNLVFEPPDVTASVLKLTLPGSALGQSGAVILIIPKNRIRVVPDPRQVPGEAANPLVAPVGPAAPGGGAKIEEDIDKPPMDLGIPKVDP